MPPSSAKSSISRVILFDMDGTLTRPLLDFDQMRGEIGLGPGPLLEAIRDLPPVHRERAEAILAKHEALAAANSELQPWAAEVTAALRSAGFPLVLMTRNSRASVDHVLRRHALEFDLIWTREDGPMKPSPEPVFEICRRLHADPRDAVVIGDFHFDIVCGNAAGSRTVLYLEPGMERPPWADEAHAVIRDLRELKSILELS